MNRNAAATLRIDAERMNARIEALAAIERKDDGSCCRLALTDADRAARDMVVGWMRDAGLNVRVDRIGNIIGAGPGASDRRPVMTGSHIDTVATGGRYDGVLGVIAGLEVAQSLRDAGRSTARPIAVGVFTNEEGVRYQPDMMGSLVYAGGLSVEEALDRRAADGTRLGDELERIGYAGDTPVGELRPHAFVEVHIEQGPVLDREGGVLGAVENLQGISWQEIRITGTSNHAGTTPMGLRRDAAMTAARISVFLEDLTRRIGGVQVATVGSMRLFPNLINVIAGRAVMTADLRNVDDVKLEHAEQELALFLEQLAQSDGVEIKAQMLARTAPVQFHASVLAAIEGAAADLDQPIRRMTSGAGHDAQMMARICPAAMIFVPSVGGVSHNPREFTAPHHLEIGANALLQAMLRLAGDAG